MMRNVEDLLLVTKLARDADYKQAIIILMDIVAAMQDDIGRLRNEVDTLNDSISRKVSPKGSMDGGFSIG